MQTEQDPFVDIRPYNDSEVAGAIERLIADQDFIDAILHYRFPHLSGPLGWLLSPILKVVLKRKWARLKTVKDVQLQVSRYMKSTMANTTAGFSYSGVEQLKTDQAYLFISNHRDIAMDPAIVNWCLHKYGMNTARIAIGDNLLKKPCVTELMRLNKSFIVRRSMKGPREMLKALSQLSAYIHHSLGREKQSIWIAQREGRAKDGNDVTEAAMLKMLYMEGRKQGISFAEDIGQLHIVPVTISYEFDPCDKAKVRELVLKQTQGHYQKGEFEDIDSIIQGIVGFKGRVHVAFGQMVQPNVDSPDELAAALDTEIYRNYRLFPINYLAAGVEHESITEQDRSQWQQKLAEHSEAEQAWLQTMYAAPVKKQQKAAEPVTED
ncbi:1-acyl-sn-glycerol-3-phosphate acyltransferase [Alkalimonas collagenimarina]|uniref:1-acyl-sn-glycerol-3-phosphate acyltransferase n=1 Tax=Alkalimonas collagenimarina TaxID=400390 RepID=A0ABT9H2S7_9GAMM|nr:1-acyl-sn-glycerol-3-phosphate acyltransferase [Alkalimonas collagenimarina]MDP4537205.1 1-acyl-sn-glycerol-3-phosphate acyltransferase [Alkalimonas collagenimarina]